MNDLVKELRRHWQIYVQRDLGDYPHEEHARDCELCQAADRIERLENVAEATRYFMLNDKTGGLTGSKQVVDALEALDE